MNITLMPFGIFRLQTLTIVAVSISLLLGALFAAAPALAQSEEKPRAPELYEPITTHNTVDLQWWETDDPAVPGITYEVQRRANPGEGWIIVDGTYGDYTHYSDGSVGIPWTDSSVSPDIWYTYRVYAIEGDLRSDSSARLLAITKPAPEGYVAPVSTPEPTPEATPEAIPEAMPVSIPEPTPEATLEATPEATPVSTPEVTPEATPEATPDTQNDDNNQQQQQQDQGNNGETDEVVQNNEKPSKIEELDGGEGDPVVEGPSKTRSTSTSSSITLEWTAPVGATPTGYRIWMTTGDSPSAYQFYDYETSTDDEGIETTTLVIIATLKVSDTNSSSTSSDITGLAANTLHHFWVAALYGTDTKTQGLISQRMSLNTDPTNTAPSAVRNLQVIDLPNDKVRVLWDAAEESTTCIVNGHTVTKWSIGGDRDSQNIGNVTMYDWEEVDLLPDDTYVFTVTPKCGSVTGEWNTVTFTTGPEVTRPPVPQPHLSKSTATQVELKWYTEGNPKDNNWGFEVERKPGAGIWSVVTGTYAGGSTTEPGGFGYSNGGFATIWYDRSVASDTFYTYRISTVDRDNSNTKSVTSELVTAQTLIATSTGTPGAPVNVQTGLVLTSPNAVRIMWDPPDDIGSSAITGYQILKNNSVLVTNTGDTNTTYDDEAVEEGRRYLYRIRAINSQGAGLRSRIARGVSITFSVNPPPGTTVHTRPARAGTSATVQIKNNVDDDDATMKIVWTDGTAGLRVCHTDYYIIYGVKQTDGTYKYQFGTNGSTGNPDITIAGLWYVVNFNDPVGPYMRSYETTLDALYTTSDPPETDYRTLDFKIKVYCGHPAESDHVEIGEAAPAIVTTINI